jgi:hypothetical protein
MSPVYKNVYFLLRKASFEVGCVLARTRTIAEIDRMGASPNFPRGCEHPPYQIFRTSLFYLIIVQLTTGALDNKMAWESVILALMRGAGVIAAWKRADSARQGHFGLGR